MTPTMEAKSQQVLERAYKGLGGSGSYSPTDTSQFRTAVESASPKQLDKAWHDEIWQNLLKPCVQEGQSIPTNVIEQVDLIFSRMHQVFAESGVAGRSS